MARRCCRFVLVLLLAGIAIAPRRAGSQASIEYQLLSLVNGGRSDNLVMHSGLVGAARSHSREMAASGSLSHAGARARVSRAAPDPSETNGAPDDGFTGTWCENIAYVSGDSASDVASRVYDGWKGSATHLHCMTDPNITATGIGVYFDGETWWATMEAFGDTTPPGPAATNVEETPAPLSETEIPQETTRPELTPKPTAETDASVAAPSVSSPTSDATPLGWPEVAAGLGIIGVSLLSYRQFNRAQRTR
jgi:hypothetical protein